MKAKMLFLGFFISSSIMVSAQLNGEFTKGRFFYGENYKQKTIESLTVKWSFSTLYGEPVLNGSFKWEAGYDTPSDFLKYNDVIILELDNTYGRNCKCIKLNPTVPKAGEGFGYNVSGSPSWSNVFCDYDGESLGLTAAEAKAYWEKGFRITGVHLVRVDN
jgi:hypothetical protein